MVVNEKMNVQDSLLARAELYERIWNYCIDEIGLRSAPLPRDVSSIELLGVLLVIATEAGESTVVDRDTFWADICAKHGIKTCDYQASFKKFASLVQPAH
ncbi:hypothetical protein CU102_24055 [Phyllobacterium brassicacearum]|uniref:Uncharacterized protein n=1 Tax=Phyllobacterium brassicacearum TaxID=314235 RepID=A0A2P7BA49_9HYPH|nr:hypothetical protein [Phyllobacterium brassicacearum]PSH63340.1 hypothetical protein CU102_24055 [Phyllobacterium brassicacearum]TDQ18192.1 hypothetical protein DEV91_12555 [Phyllobacterium brassicacearum]